MYDAALVVTATACGLMGGVFAAFSTFVMAGLGRLSPPEGIRAMQAVDRTAVTPAFMGLFLGTTALSVGVGVWAVLQSDVWSDYQVRWTRWNHLRTAAGALGCALLAVALLQR